MSLFAWQKPHWKRCLCVAEVQAHGAPLVHVAGCPMAGVLKPETVQQREDPRYKNSPIIGGKRKRKGPPRKPPARIPDYAMLIQFNFTRPISLKLWKRIKAPRGWRKCPTSGPGQVRYQGVRFKCTDYRFPLAPAELEELHAKLLLSLEI